MEKHGVIPDVISVAPKEIAEIKYGNVKVNLGDELTPTQVKVCAEICFMLINFISFAQV